MPTVNSYTIAEYQAQTPKYIVNDYWKWQMYVSPFHMTKYNLNELKIFLKLINLKKHTLKWYKST